ncbi:hypothetical protein WJU23_16665 [Prosthecobacter sp. SYSU 5D2]|uniref:hypothetical protein n=1 Tax=Prosthecobacter sp. SYSU 5D2 TaxID=3134134 RepID=UPI0031FEC873
MMTKIQKVKSVIAIVLFLICVALIYLIQALPKNWIGDLDAIAKKRGKLIVFQISQAVVDYKKENNGEYPDKISDLIPLYLTDPGSLLGGRIEGWLKISGTDMSQWPEAMDITGLASLYPKEGGEFIVVLSPVLYGSEAVPFFHFRPGDHPDGHIKYETMNYKEMDLVEACKLVRSPNWSAKIHETGGLPPPPKSSF